MSFSYGASSKRKLNTVCHELRETFYRALEYQIYDIAIVWGWRGEEAQNQAFLSGNSDVQWPDSKHNFVTDGVPLSHAVDFAPWCLLSSGRMGIPWKDTHAFAVVGGIVLAAARDLGHTIRWGGDWDMDGTTTDQRLMDWGHVEI